jgi:hypothetical protein
MPLLNFIQQVDLGHLGQAKKTEPYNRHEKRHAYRHQRAQRQPRHETFQVMPVRFHQTKVVIVKLATKERGGHKDIEEKKACCFNLGAINVQPRFSSPEGAIYSSPGQRPGNWVRGKKALKETSAKVSFRPKVPSGTFESSPAIYRRVSIKKRGPSRRDD